MADILSKQQRSVLMSKVRSGDTKPEWVLRCGLHKLGFRYRVRDRHLPGRPDLVFPKYRSVVFVHGCYWHRHVGCSDAGMPKSNVSFWTGKFAENLKRDRLVEGELGSQGWRVMVVWECELVNRTGETIAKVAIWLRESNAESNFPSYQERVLEHQLLAVAERKVRYRIAKYTERPEPSGDDSPEN